MSADSLRQQLQSEDLGERLRAVNHVRELPATEAVELLLFAAQDGSARVRYAALSQLGTHPIANPDQVLPTLRQALLSDPEVDVRAAAAACLGDLKATAALTDLLAAYDRETEWLLQFSVIAALGELGDRGAFETVVAALAHANDLVRTAAAAALGDLADPRAVPYLAPLAADSDWQMRFRVCLALGQIKDATTQPLLVQLAQDEHEQVAQAARRALGEASEIV